MNRHPSADQALPNLGQFSTSRARGGGPSFAVYALAAGMALILAAALILQSLEPYGWVEQFQQAALP